MRAFNIGRHWRATVCKMLIYQKRRHDEDKLISRLLRGFRDFAILFSSSLLMLLIT